MFLADKWRQHFVSFLLFFFIKCLGSESHEGAPRIMYKFLKCMTYFVLQLYLHRGFILIWHLDSITLYHVLISSNYYFCNAFMLLQWSFLTCIIWNYLDSRNYWDNSSWLNIIAYNNSLTDKHVYYTSG